MKNLLSLLLLSLSMLANSEELAVKTALEISREARLSSSSPQGNPLPLIGSWNQGELPNTYDPKYQLDLIEKGHHLYPWFHIDVPGMKTDIKVEDYYEESLGRLIKLKLPVTLISSQWERLLTDQNKYLKLPAPINPNVVSISGKIMKKVSPMGDENHWEEVGREWANMKWVREFQSRYHNPSSIIFLSNNEHKKLSWVDADQDYRFVKQYGSSTNKKERNEVFSRRWLSLYRSLQNGMRNGLINENWKRKIVFVGYNAFGPSVMGRWPAWDKYSIETLDSGSVWPLVWDGASLPFYTHNWDLSTDYNVWGPMVGAHNWVLMKEDALANNPDFWLEISIWDGYQPKKSNDKRKYYTSQGQEYGPKRYGGMVKYAMWLLRPRLVREFRNPDQTIAETEHYFMELVEAVDSIYDSDDLSRFWRKGELVANNKHKHPYQDNIPDKYKSRERWFLLDTNYDQRRPWNLHTEIPVFVIAHLLGSPPNREWLLYSFSPLGNRENVLVNIPHYKTVEISAFKQGGYYLVSERNNSIEQIP